MRPVGFFDSGVGGLCVLMEARRLLPREHFVFYGDNRNAPYGPRPLEEIRNLTRAGVDFLLEKGIKALVIACNTATSASAAILRKELAIPVIGIEPALKPAQLSRRGGKVLVLATQATLCLEKFHLLMERYGEGAVPIIGNGLVELVETGKQNTPEAKAALHALLDPQMDGDVDGIVLGCTHFPFLLDDIRSVAPGVPVFDGAEGTARQLARVLQEHGLLEDADGKTELFSSGGEKAIALMRRMLCT